MIGPPLTTRTGINTQHRDQARIPRNGVAVGPNTHDPKNSGGQLNRIPITENARNLTDRRGPTGRSQGPTGAAAVVLGPSNPVASLGPILAVPGIRAAVAASRDRCVAVTPVVTAVPLDPGEATRARSRAALLQTAGVAASATGVAGLHAELAATFVLDRADAAEADAIGDLGLLVLADTLLRRGADAGALAAAVLGV